VAARELTEERPLSGAEIRELTAEVADHLDPHGVQHSLILVGGSLLAWHGLRDTTEDVDSVRRFDAELRDAIARVALSHNLSPTWLNANAAMFMPATLDPATCAVLLDHPQLLVLGASMRDVFVMKMYRAHPNDQIDMISIWAQTGFNNPQEAVDAFFAAYPHAPDDPHLDEFVARIVSRALP
jgi:hypothetical protein